MKKSPMLDGLYMIQKHQEDAESKNRYIVNSTTEKSGNITTIQIE